MNQIDSGFSMQQMKSENPENVYNISINRLRAAGERADSVGR